VCSSTAEAREFIVDKVFDAVDANPGDGICESVPVYTPGQEEEPDFGCTLRAAIMEANAFPGADNISMASLIGSALFPIKLTLMGTSTETEGYIGDLDIVDKLIITGRGMDSTIIVATDLYDRIFDIHGPAVVEMSGMTLKGGQVIGDLYNYQQDDDLPPVQYDQLVCDPWYPPMDGADGGAILNRGAVVFIEDVKFEDNLALCDGGAINSTGDAVMKIKKCRFEYNVALSDGGAVENDEDSIMVIRGSKFLWNNAYEQGGAIHNDDSMMKIRNCRMKRNTAQDTGGAIWNGDSDPMLVKKSIIKKNDAYDGGGIWNNDGFLELIESTVVYNSPNDVVDYNMEEGW
jgi:predicted outer membrane repeat protein